MEDKQAFFDASASIVTDSSNTSMVTAELSDSDRADLPMPKILGKIELKDNYRTTSIKVPKEEEIIKEINHFSKDGNDVSIKGVIDSLANWHGYDRRLLYSLANLMVDKQILELYSYKNEKGFDAKGVRIVNK